MTSNERHEARYQRRHAKRLEKKRRANVVADHFERVYTYKNLFASYRECRKGVRWKASTQSYIANAPLNVYKTYKSLSEGLFSSHGFCEFDVFERGKKRHIRSVDIHERVVQRCTCDYSLVPALSRSFIYDNGASMAHKGYTFAINRIQRHLRRHIQKHGNKGYILLYDFSSFFDSIPHALIEKIIDKAYTDERIKAQILHFVGMFGSVGIGLGSQISQVLALASANELDHFIKERLHIKGYGRYMDDGYAIHESREYLQECMHAIKAKCDELGLILNLKKTRIVPIRRDFTFLKIKYRVTESGHLVRRAWRKSIVRMRRKLKKFARKLAAGEGKLTFENVRQSFQSWKDHWRKTDSRRTIRNMTKLFDALFDRKAVQAA